MARTGIMLCQPLEEKRLLRWNVKDILCQPKLDGERMRVIIDKPSIFMLSSEENLITSCPHIEEALRSLDLPQGTELDGEIYAHDLDFSEIHSRRGRTTNLHRDYQKLEFHIFDLVNGLPQLERIAKLCYLLRDLPSSAPLKLVPSALINPSLDEILALMESYTYDGFEGIIVRHPDGSYERKRSGFVMKFKPRKSDTYKIVDTQEEVDKNGVPKNSLGALICTSDEGTLFGVGSGFTREQRAEYWEVRESLPGMLCVVKYQQISPKHVPRFPIFSEIIPMVIGLTKEQRDATG